jgi:MFS family permease
LDKPASDDGAPPGSDPARWTPARRFYVLAVLCVVAVVYFIDRQIVTILVEPIKREFHASDTLMGVLTGPVFALSYVLAAIPVARLIDGRTRRNVLAICLVIWSVLTSLGGFAQSFLQLAFSRVGVAVAESAAPPTGYSMISDLYPAKFRATALAAFTASQSLGIGLGVVLGGVLSQAFNWRISFLIVGVPGVLLAGLLMATVKEPPRGLSDDIKGALDPIPLGVVFRQLWSIRSYRCLAAVTGLAGFTGYGMLIWGPSFMLRTFHLSRATAGLWFGFTTAAALMGGNLFGGVMADRLGKRDLRAYMWVAAAGPVLCIPAGLWFAASSNWRAALVAFFLLQFLLTSHIPASYAMSQTLVPSRMRATAASILGMSSTIIGSGLAPPLIGASNDLLQAHFGAAAIRYSVAIVMLGALAAAAAALLATIWIRGDRDEIQRWAASGEVAGSGTTKG